MYATIPKMPRLSIEREHIDIEKSQNSRQETLRYRKICMSSPNIANDEGGKLDTYLTYAIVIIGTPWNSEKNN